MKKKLNLLFIFLLLVAYFKSPVLAATSKEDIQVLEQKVQSTQNQQTTLSDMVKYFDTVKALNEAEISQTNQLLASSAKLDPYQGASVFTGLTPKLFLSYPFSTLGLVVHRVGEKILGGKVDNPVTNEGKMDQGRKIQLLVLSNRLDSQKKQLAQIAAEKAELLRLTNNDEKKYESMLVTAREELQAQQAIASGKGEETKIGSIKAGEKIASIIIGQSACSTGTHLHFEMRNNGLAVNPAQFLPQTLVKYASPLILPISFTGSYHWPVPQPVYITQEYGFSWFARPGGYSVKGAYNGLPHTGIDMLSQTESKDVLAAADGVLYKGKLKCGGGILSYMRVVHPNSLSTYYLHVKEL